MNSLEPQMTQQERIDHFIHLGKPTLNANEAAFLLGASKRTLERWRQAGTGPAFRKNPATPSSLAGNQKVYYLLTDLVEFSKYTFKSNIDLAISRGFAFATLDCLLEDHPFFINVETGLIEAHAYLVGPDDLFDYHPSRKYKLIWLSWASAFNQGWNSPLGSLLKERYHQLLNKEFEQALEEEGEEERGD